MHRLDRAVNEGNLENHFMALPIRRSDDQHIVITRTNISITQPTRTRRRGGASFGLLFGCCGNSAFPPHFPPYCPNSRTAPADSMSYYRKLWIRCGNEEGGVPFRVGNANPGGSRVEGDATDVEGSRTWGWKGSRRAAF